MDATHVGAVISGIAIGWGLKTCYPPASDCPACKCHCACHHTSSGDSQNWVSFNWLVVILLVTLAAVAANTALAFKVKLISKGEERELAVSVKGKSKGLYGASRALAISG